MARYSHNIRDVGQYQRKGVRVVRCRVRDHNGFVRWEIETEDGAVERDFGCFTSPEEAIRDLRRALGAPATSEGEEDEIRARRQANRPHINYRDA